MKGILNVDGLDRPVAVHGVQHLFHPPVILDAWPSDDRRSRIIFITRNVGADALKAMLDAWAKPGVSRSEEHTSELQSLMRISYAVFCLKKKKLKHTSAQSDNNIRQRNT